MILSKPPMSQELARRTKFLELCVLQLIKAIREGNFSLHKKSLVSLVPWMFSLDHINYARWKSVHICDMSLLFSSLTLTRNSQMDLLLFTRLRRFSLQLL